MRLFIAEKPSVVKAIADELGVTGKEAGVIHAGDDKVTWCFGHMLEWAEPDEYTSEDAARNPKTGKKYWRVEDLPILPKEWIIKPKMEAQTQLAIIGRLMKEASLIVNAGDADREGQLLIDEVLTHFNNTKPVLRFWVAAHDSISLQRGLNALKDNRDYEGLGMAALARSKADWLIGMNLSRAYTLSTQRGGANTLITVGRVQTPTLKLVVDRDRSIEQFQSKPFYTIEAHFEQGSVTFLAKWQAKTTQAGLDDEGRLIDKTIADTLVNHVSGKPGVVLEYLQAPQTKGHPKAYSLSDLTLVASNRYGYTAAEVLEICQALYETHKLTTYPRTDCSYLPESQHQDAKAVLDALKTVNPDMVDVIDKANPAIKSKTWNDTKVTVHYGIIPTQHKGSKVSLTEKERTLYELIVRSYIAQFYPAHEFLSTDVNIDAAGECFTVKGRTVVKNGWCAVFEETREKEKAEDDSMMLPPLAKGDAVFCRQALRLDAKTKPQARYTEGTLQRAMENIDKVVDDVQHKKILKEGDGIGTAATRASIISELKRRQFIETQGKQLVSTALGRSLVDALPEMVKSPVLTALFERLLKSIEHDPKKLDDFLDKQTSFVSEQVRLANESALTLKGVKACSNASSQYACQRCQKPLIRRKGAKGYWWSCSGYPSCTQTCSDLKGTPRYNQQKQGKTNEKTSKPTE